MESGNSKIIKKLMLNQITKAQYLKLVGIDQDAIKEKIYTDLAYAYNQRDETLVEYCIYLLCIFNVYDEQFVTLLNQLLLSDWHYQHENIAELLQELRNPSSVIPLYETVNKRFEYLDYDEFNTLAVKCIWALGDIASDTAKKCLLLLQENEDRIISSNAKKQIMRLERV